MVENNMLAPLSTTTQASIRIATTEMTYYSPIVLLIVGIISCLCNFITFTSPQLRKSSCAFYFLLSSIFELFGVTFGLISRFAADHLGSTLINTDRAYCKLRAYLVSILPLIATYMILLSSIDRCLSSSVSARLRLFGQMKVAYVASAVAILLAFVSGLHILIGYDLRPRCAALPGVFAMYDSMFVVFWLGVIPHVLMLLFGFLTLMNVRRTKQRIAVKPAKNANISDQQQEGHKQKTDAQLMMMMLVQVGLSFILIMTRMIYYAYYVLGPSLTGYDKLVGSFLMSFTTQVYYANYCKSFYIYTLSSGLFRRVFVQRVTYYPRKVLNLRKPIKANMSDDKTDDTQTDVDAVTRGIRRQR
ncbi:unnamed protein product [Adineta ricciae]|uniref:G-protein coupled receptors family 1 profile domain-containing protein n=1 Tax=Adineta ricciae TaxID=249248 RepID=A0A813YU07_ADIRI|nr:unnamed protein product [Adineta ricciae]